MQTNMCNQTCAIKHEQTNLCKQTCANKLGQTNLKTFLVRTCAFYNPWLGGQTMAFLRIDTVAAEQLEATNRQGGGAGQQTSPPHNKHPPPSSTDFWKIKPRGRCILICLMLEQVIFPCSASIKNKKGQIYLTTNLIKETKTGNSNLANCCSFL